MTATVTERRTAVGTAGGAFTGTGALVRFILRRDRVRLPVWLAGLTVGTIATASSFQDLYRGLPEREQVAATMNSPAGLAMTGPSEYLRDYHYGSMLSHQMLGFMAVMVGLMSVLTIVRHTRAEEESGRAELVRATVVGRHAHLSAALAVVVGANVVLALLLTVGLGGLGIEGITWGGSALYGAAHAAAGLVFAATAAVTVQVTEHSRGAAGLAFAVIGVAYVLRAAGDVGNGVLSWLSPIGWTQATWAYLDDRWWPLLPAVALTALLVGAAFELSTRRDVGAGLRQPRPGAGAASETLVRPIGFALRLHRGLLIGFAVAMLVLGMAYGSILGDAEGMLGGVDVLEEALADLGGATLADSFASMVPIVMAIIGAVYVVLATLRTRAEETAGRAEPLLATPLSRARWLGSHLVVVLVGAVVMMLSAGIGFGVSGASSMADVSYFPKLVGAALVYVPALWVTAGLAAVLFAVVPRAATLAWIVPLYAFVVGYLGQILQFPAWLDNVSPFGHIPRLPAEDLAVTPLLVLTAIAAVLVAWALAGFREREINVS